MSNIGQTIICIALLHIAVCAINTLILFACFQRKFDSNLVEARERAKRDFINALICGSCGIFSLVPVLLHTKFPSYGVKFWPGEDFEMSKKWYVAKISATHSQTMNKIPIDIGEPSCITIWYDD